MSILIVDDEFGIRESLSQLLEDEGFQVTAVADGEEALDYLLLGQKHPCLILLDLMMPGLNGWDFIQEQRRNPILASVPVAIISARRDLHLQAAALGVEDYIEKPVDVDTLFQVVERYCGR
jgi:CheY-like chemotaxis protein